MNRKTISVISLSNRDYGSFSEKLEEAVRWMSYAADQGADLVVLPELLNAYFGDGPENPHAPSLSDIALADWQSETQSLRRAAMALSLAVVVPVLIREGSALRNVFFLISKEGETIGSFSKLVPTPGEIESGVSAGSPSLLLWQGISIGGLICFDTNYPQLFETLSNLGVQLVVIPSLWNGGPWLSGFAARYAVPIAIASPAWSQVIDLDGAILAAGGYRQETIRFGFGAPVFTATLNFDREVFHLNDQAAKIGEIQHRYRGQLIVRMLHEQAAFSIESISEDLSVAQIVEEHGLIPFRKYLAASGPR